MMTSFKDKLTQRFSNILRSHKVCTNGDCKQIAVQLADSVCTNIGAGEPIQAAPYDYVEDYLAAMLGNYRVTKKR